MGKDKKKSAEKKARTAEKAARKTEKKGAKASKKQKSSAPIDADDQDIDAVLAEYAAKQAQFLKVTETVLSEPPPVRSGAVLTASPTTSELFLFGGETFNGSVAHFFNDLTIYNPSNNIWRSISSPNAPLPRSGHWITATSHSGGTLWLFGGEFSSPKQNTFHHYHDFWSFDVKAREWSRIETKGKTPPARSGHRMIGWKNFIVLWGGFQDTSMTTKYLNDLWIFDIDNYTWGEIKLAAHAQRPDARSSFSFLPTEIGAVLFGGYSKQKVQTSGTSSTGRKQQIGKNTTTEVGHIHDDTWVLRLDTDLTKVRWERRKKPGNLPNPKRVGVTMAFHKGRGIMFGGVHDAAETDESLESVFFNELYAWSTDRNRFFPLALRKPKTGKRVVVEQRGGRRDRAREGEEELLRNLARLEAEAAGRSAADVEAEEKRKADEEEAARLAAAASQELTLELPSVRFNTALAVLDDVLYIYGGTIEKGDREFFHDEMYAIDLGKLDGVRTIFSRKVESDWVDSEDEDEDEEDDEDDEDEDEDEDEEEEAALEGDSKKPKISSEELSRLRAEKEAKKAAKLAAEEEAASEAASESTSDEPVDTTPSPRPFESLREFFTRTGNDWQNVIIAQMELASVLHSQATHRVEPKTVKEIRKDAFDAAEKKWWDAREEMREIEDAQEEAGIGETVNLEDKRAAGGGGGAKRR